MSYRITGFVEKSIVVIAVTVFAALVAFTASALPPEIEADKYLLSAKKSIDNGDYRSAVGFFEKILALKIPVPSEFYFHYGKSLSKVDRWQDAGKNLEEYVNQTGREGKFYKEALEILNEAESKAAAEKAALEKAPSTMKFVYIPPGTFIMGCPESEPGRFDSENQHRVTLTKGFYMQTTEVTQGQWKAVMGNNPSCFKECGDDCPVEQVSWEDVQEFIKKLSRKERKEYRLPTEAEWEYAARAGSTTAFANGDITETECGHDPNLDAMGWYCGNSDIKTHPVAQKQPNGWGLYDMHGNVWEWCSDWLNAYPAGAVTNPKGPDNGSYRVSRGGCYFYDARFCRSAISLGVPPGNRDVNLGFRVLREAP